MVRLGPWGRLKRICVERANGPYSSLFDRDRLETRKWFRRQRVRLETGSLAGPGAARQRSAIWSRYDCLLDPSHPYKPTRLNKIYKYLLTDICILYNIIFVYYKYFKNIWIYSIEASPILWNRNFIFVTDADAIIKLSDINSNIRIHFGASLRNCMASQLR